MGEAVDHVLLTGLNYLIISVTHRDKSAMAGKWVQFSLVYPYPVSLSDRTFTESHQILLSINTSLINYVAPNTPSGASAHL